MVCRQAYAGLLWTKQFYHYVIQYWLEGDPDTPTPPNSRLKGRNSEMEWQHLFNRDVVSMPDKWEYPWVSMRHKQVPLKLRGIVVDVLVVLVGDTFDFLTVET